ncbi:MAG: helix-turn-helix domain-containing protein [Solirubrobacterales bacterium]
MERETLEGLIEQGCSLAEMGRRLERHPSTIWYWLQKHDLRPAHREHAPRGSLDRETLTRLVGEDLTVREIATRVGRSPTTVRYWLRRHGLQTTATARRRSGGVARRTGQCPRHGRTPFVLSRGSFRCARCRAEAVTRWRRTAKRTLVAEAGGRCVACGYDRCIAALQFHHLDRAKKRFGLGARGLARSIDVLRAEAAQCALLCANCHAEVEAGVRVLAPAQIGLKAA